MLRPCINSASLYKEDGLNEIVTWYPEDEKPKGTDHTEEEDKYPQKKL